MNARKGGELYRLASRSTLGWFKRARKSYLQAEKSFSQFLSHNEKVILALLAVVIVVSGSVWFRQFSQGHASGPSAGGSYVEGIVGTQAEVQQIATRLTKTGLLGFDAKGELVNHLVDSWSVNADKTEYTFVLKDGLDKDEILRDITDNQNLIGPSLSEYDGEGNLVVTLTTPNPNLPLIMTQPIFNYGPFKLSKTTQKTTIFSRNPREGAVQPYLNKVVVHAYSQIGDLEQALQKGKLDGSESVSLELPKRFKNQEFKLPRYYAILFNVNRTPFRDENFRKGIVAGTQGSGSFTLTVADQEPNKSLAQEAVARFATQGVTVTLDVKPAEEVTSKIAPSRSFQALLAGMDYGMEVDPYYLWHSSQIRPPGNNLTGLKSEAIDKLIDEIRNTHNIDSRLKQVEALNSQLHQAGAALILKQETIDFVVSDEVKTVTPWIAQTPADRYRSIGLWYRN